MPFAYSRDLSNRIGLGYNNSFSNTSFNRLVPAISIKYGVSKDMAVAGLIGLSTVYPSVMTLGTKVFKNLFYENNLNFYTAFAIAYVKMLNSGVELMGLLGAEYFIPGVESLGLSFETGIGANNLNETFEIKTLGFTFLHAGIHFYF